MPVFETLKRLWRQRVWQRHTTAKRRHVAGRVRLRVEAVERRLLLANDPVMITDANVTTAGSFPDEFIDFGGVTFFTANDGVHGRELWKTDGTEANTVLVKDIDPGRSGSEIQ